MLRYLSLNCSFKTNMDGKQWKNLSQLVAFWYVVSLLALDEQRASGAKSFLRAVSRLGRVREAPALETSPSSLNCLCEGFTAPAGGVFGALVAT